MVLLYPTIGIAWEGRRPDPQLATAYSRAYNRWIVDFCSADRRRLVPDRPHHAARSGRRRRRGRAGAAATAASACICRPIRRRARGKAFDDPSFAPFWATVPDLEMPVAFHVVAREDMSSRRGRQSATGRRRWCSCSRSSPLEVMAAFTSMMTRGLFEKYPRLRCAVLEAGSNWITAWLDRLDHKVEAAAVPAR